MCLAVFVIWLRDIGNDCQSQGFFNALIESVHMCQNLAAVEKMPIHWRVIFISLKLRAIKSPNGGEKCLTNVSVICFDYDALIDEDVKSKRKVKEFRAQYLAMELIRRKTRSKEIFMCCTQNSIGFDEHFYASAHFKLK